MATLHFVRVPVRGRAALLAALTTALAVCFGDAVARQYPFGRHSREVSDLGNQFVPFHAHLWDLLHGKTPGGLLLNWQAGFGAASLPDLGTYLTSPFALLVGVFPRDRIDLAVYVITVLKMAVAGAVMAAVLPRIAARAAVDPPWWAAGLLGATYALCGWSVIEASYNPMWMDGLIGFPLLCLVGEWARTGRRPVLGPLTVALVWVANFYTAYMATIGAALVLVLRLLLEPGIGSRARLTVLLRAAWRVALGIGLAAPVLIPVYLGTKHAYPGSTATFIPAPWTTVFARVMPGTYTFSSPAMFVGAGALLLVAGLAFDRRVPVRERFGWVGLVLAVAVSLQWRPTSLAWHAFAIPNGSRFRETFILAGIVVMAAWTALSRGWPSLRPLLCGAGVLAALWAGAVSSPLSTRDSLGLFVLAVAGAGVGLLLLGRHAGPRTVAVAALLLVGSLLGQGAAAMAYGDHAKLAEFTPYPIWGSDQDARAAAVAKVDDWPVYRTDPGRELLTGDDPMLIGGEGAGYYSSMTADVYTRTMKALGAGWSSTGRVVQSLDNPVTDAIFAIGARIRTEPGSPPVTVRESVPPLVTVRPAHLPAGVDPDAVINPKTGLPRYGNSPFRNQEALLGAHVYTVPADRVCPVGTEEFLSAPEYWGFAGLHGNTAVRLRGGLPKSRAALTSLGMVRTAGEHVVFGTRTWRTSAPADWSVGCLDHAELTAAVARLKQTAATSVRVTDSGIHAELPKGSTGYAVLSSPRIAGWTCGGKPADSYLGLVAVRLDGGTTMDCSFRPPGVKAGGAAGVASLAGLAAIGFVGRRGRGRGRRRGSRRHGPGASEGAEDARDAGERIDQPA